MRKNKKRKNANWLVSFTRKIIYFFSIVTAWIIETYYFVITWLGIKLSFFKFHFKKEEIKNFGKEVKELARKKENRWISPAIAFYLLIAAIPTVAIILIVIFRSEEIRTFVTNSILSVFSISDNTDVAQRFTDEINQIFNSFNNSFDQNQGVGIAILVISSTIVIFGAINIATKGMRKIIEMANTLYGIKHTIKNYFKAYLLFIGFIILSLGIIAVLFVINLLFQIQTSSSSRAGFISLGLTVQFFAGMLLLYLVFLLLHISAPTAKISWRQVHSGAVITAFLVSAVALIFSISYSLLFAYANIYGSIAIIITAAIFLLWISRSIFVGFCLNAVFLKRIYLFAPSKEQTILKVKKIKSITLDKNNKGTKN